MTRFLCSAALTLLLCRCAAEEPAPAPATAADTAPATTTTAPSPAPVATATVPADHDVTGAYFPIDPLPVPFAELEHLSLANIDENAAPAPLNGFLRPKVRSAEDYVLVEPKLEGQQLTFTTTAHGGVHYTFEGRFEVLGKFPENPPSYETVVLTGTLQRLRDGQPAASTPVRFRYEAGG